MDKNGKILNENGTVDVEYNQSYETEIIFKNGSKETVLHGNPPSMDSLKYLHFKLNDGGIAINLDEVRKYRIIIKNIATRELKIIT